MESSSYGEHEEKHHMSEKTIENGIWTWISEATVDPLVSPNYFTISCEHNLTRQLNYILLPYDS